jgi:hypothetical protein
MRVRLGVHARYPPHDARGYVVRAPVTVHVGPGPAACGIWGCGPCGVLRGRGALSLVMQPVVAALSLGCPAHSLRPHVPTPIPLLPLLPHPLPWTAGLHLRRCRRGADCLYCLRSDAAHPAGRPARVRQGHRVQEVGEQVARGPDRLGPLRGPHVGGHHVQRRWWA